MRAPTHSPEAARAFMGFGMFIRNTSRLNGRLRELAILQVGCLARTDYEWTHHLRIGRRSLGYRAHCRGIQLRHGRRQDPVKRAQFRSGGSRPLERPRCSPDVPKPSVLARYLRQHPTGLRPPRLSLP
ncbi:MAG: carboxymuconolactone decarboxylase family protein [Alphaproteobacteria bacterium]|nr:carboxymuconolactone decarboxylase family protein [Alphaproteobacteria bacterium]MDP6238759.1 carboxymuconolactone decarboxylase family protein [Alphaproteobacteria bacterium]MDP7173871.1 carboxymuconolactone decarboxylase family protein [Alphaproteobacteria bacterium]MDP7233087.1 carboxymuconolactone decarboxylase family protein [Alphaproteobacteria bacterium]MDP7487086.1 carboxymuconolactone decarboxylase family protein [Alphaproteobacteria bacterium]